MIKRFKNFIKKNKINVGDILIFSSVFLFTICNFIINLIFGLYIFSLELFIGALVYFKLK